jgi:hypothetical protein
MIALGAGSPTRAICLTLIAQAFQSDFVAHWRYRFRASRYRLYGLGRVSEVEVEVARIRHHSLLVSRDFDIFSVFHGGEACRAVIVTRLS